MAARRTLEGNLKVSDLLGTKTPGPGRANSNNAAVLVELAEQTPLAL